MKSIKYLKVSEDSEYLWVYDNAEGIFYDILTRYFNIEDIFMTVTYEINGYHKCFWKVST